MAVIREIADMAEKSGLHVAIYPHLGMYVERIEDALRLVKKVDRKNVGVAFNLCHFLKLDDEKNLEQRLKEAKPHLFAVSINGADGGDTNQMDWNRLIQTLDRGSFDVGRVLKTLKQLGLHGAHRLAVLRHSRRQSRESEAIDEGVAGTPLANRRKTLKLPVFPWLSPRSGGRSQAIF